MFYGQRVDETQLIRTAARAISTPKVAPADSFVLHAPLELLARAALLPFVADPHRDEARSQVTRLQAQYEDAGDPVAEPTDQSLTIDTDEAATRLLAAVNASELDD